MPTKIRPEIPDEHAETLVQLVQQRALHQTDQTAYVFLNNGETEDARVTYGQLDTQARAIATQLQQMDAQGERALLLFPAGLEYIAAFFGCLYAGTIAVPVYPPHPARVERSLPRLQSIAHDAQPRVALMPAASQPTIERMCRQMAGYENLRCLATDTVEPQAAADWHDPLVGAETIAFLQYTSGSTAAPRGVMVSHSNLLHNHAAIQSAFQHPPDAPYVSWLPLFHDMGLIGQVLQTIYLGVPCVLMSPMAFLQRPLRWLQAIARYKAATSGGPNFAFDLCVNQTTPEQRSALDLSSWKVAFNGAEPVRADTIKRFARAFAPAGFRPEAFLPCYGLAEATLFVTGSLNTGEPQSSFFRADALDQRRVVPGAANDPGSRELVHCGQTQLDHRVLIVDPETRQRCAPDQIGEIWVSGPSVAQGYWNMPEKSEQIFRASVADSGEGPFLRTGDLGLLRDGNLFVGGRLKDMIIIRGRNLYPQDIEATVQASHPALRLGGGAAFSLDAAGEERLVVVQEVEREWIRKLDVGAVVMAIRRAVAEQHEVDVYAILFLKTGSVPKTSSGKIQRHACRSGFLNQTLAIVGEWQQPAAESQEPLLNASPLDASAAPESAQAIQSWLIHAIARERQIAPEEIDIRQPFDSYGLSSAALVSLSGQLAVWLERPLAPTALYDYPTIELLTRYLVESTAPATAAVARERLAEHEPIAVIGLGCRFPGADSPEAFWRLLEQGIDAIGEVPSQRWGAAAFYAASDRLDQLNIVQGGFLNDIDQFDPAFFGISPREAEHMDPQQRVLLEVSWEALEHAGIAPDRLAGQPVGVFIGISNNDYAQITGGASEAGSTHVGTGTALSIAASRLSYSLDLRGPALVVDTACSSSLVAVHLACESLRRGESDLALAGGVNLILTPEVSTILSQAQMLSPDGRCKTFDADANGYVRSEGCGVVLLKPLAAALREGDTILALIQGSAVNQDGRSNGLTAPNGLAQQAVIRQALQHAGVEAAQIGYVETHGSGTALGDPIEVNALKAVLLPGRAEIAPCWLGSVKTNIGHLEAAAGIAGLIKTVLMLQHEAIPPHLHLERLNPHIQLEGAPLAIPVAGQRWPRAQQRRFAGVSSFGFGGTNAHIVLEEPPDQPQSQTSQRPLHLLALSAKDEQALQALAARYCDCLPAAPQVSVADLCATANPGRAHFAHRLAVIAESTEQLCALLEDFGSGIPAEDRISGKAGREQPKIAFLFTGQGAQYADMGRELYATAPVFRQALDECDAILRPHLERSVRSVLYPEPGQPTPLDETAYTQPALFALEYALARLWQSWGIVPGAVLGHSLGEYVAACIAGVFSLTDGLRLVVERARLMQALPRAGQMAAVVADEADVAAALEPYAGQVAIAAVNGPKQCVISGGSQAIQAIGDQLSTQGVKVTPLNVSHAFHSPLMEPMLEAFARVAATIRYAPPQIPIVSNLTGKLATADIATAGYWVEHVRRTVRFAAGMQSLRDQGYQIFLEIGPQPVLLGMGRQIWDDQRVAWLPSLRKQRPDWREILHSLGRLYTAGCEIRWRDFEQGRVARRLALPTYPWQRQRYWLEVSPTTSPAQERATTRSACAGERAHHPLLGPRLQALASAPNSYCWQIDLDRDRLAYLDDHRVAGATIMPMSGYVEMALCAAAEVFDQTAYRLADLALHHPLFLAKDGLQTLQVSLTQNQAGTVRFQVHGASGNKDAAQNLWVLHASATIHIDTNGYVESMTIAGHHGA